MTVNPAQAETLNVPVGDVYETLQTYLGSSLRESLHEFGHNFMVFAQATRTSADGERSQKLLCSQPDRTNGAARHAGRHPFHGRPVIISLYNFFPSATINGAANRSFSSGQALDTMQSIADKDLGPGMKFEWTAMSYQEKLVGQLRLF